MASVLRLIQQLKNIYHLITSWVYVVKYGFPARRLKIIGVTGTDGKTTTSHIIYELLKAAGLRVGLISTVAAYIGEDELDTGFHVTNPDARLLQKLLRKIADAGMEYLVLEVTSHGLDQNRVAGVGFEIGVITNITHEHLDYHLTMANYRAAKAKLIAHSKYAVINEADPNALYLKTKARGQVYGYTKTSLKLTNPALAGDYNRANVAAAETVAGIVGVSPEVVKSAIAAFPGVPGRLQELQLGQKFRAVVDFAHTPNALEHVLKELRRQLPTSKKLIVVFGCASERDTAKRPLMGRIAKKLADQVIITAEDPRHEDLGHIYDQITEGKTGFLREDDRQKALKLAVELAKPGDIVVACGKGHEKSMNLGGTEYPWSDAQAFKQALLLVSK